MNKELIKKYKEEFDWWINGDPICMLSIFNEWSNHSYESYRAFKWENPNVVKAIVKNDSYIEFRKAMAEGKVIQYSRLVDDCPTWVDINMAVWPFDKGAKHYRIKPDEPTFKVGDWCYFKKLGEEHEDFGVYLGKFDKIEDGKYIPFTGIGYDYCQKLTPEQVDDLPAFIRGD